jgi:hypothetical protein
MGWLQHRFYKKTGKTSRSSVGRRGVVGTAHIWFGRIMIVLGIVNGGLGLKLAKQSDPEYDNSRQVAYIAVAVVVGTFWLLALMWDAWGRRGLRNVAGLPDRGDGMESGLRGGGESRDSDDALVEWRGRTFMMSNPDPNPPPYSKEDVVGAGTEAGRNGGHMNSLM